MNKTKSREKAIELAQHYFRTIATRAGVKWEFHNDAEIKTLVELIIETATKAATEAAKKGNRTETKHLNIGEHKYPVKLDKSMPSDTWYLTNNPNNEDDHPNEMPTKLCRTCNAMIPNTSPSNYCCTDCWLEAGGSRRIT